MSPTSGRNSLAPAGMALARLSTTVLPPGSTRLGPLQRGDQGVSPTEARHAAQVTRSLLAAGGVQWVFTYNVESRLYELHTKTGVLCWERWRTPDGELAFRIHSLTGENPIPSVDATRVSTLEEEIAAAGGAGKPVPHERSSYPNLLERLSQLYDHPNAPDLVYIPTSGADPNHPGAGSHGVPDIVQSRAPLVMSGPGIAAGRVIDAAARIEDVAPTVAELIGVKQTIGRNTAGAEHTQFLRWQDGASLAGALTDARAGGRAVAERALIFVLDGASQTVMLDEIARGNLPNLARLVRSGTRMRYGSIVEYPTVTWANHNTLMTGASPGHNGIVNNSWYVRETGTHKLISDGGAQNVLRNGQHLSRDVETLYEAVARSFGSAAKTVAVNQPSGRGATVSILDVKGLGDVVRHGASVVAKYRDGKRTIQNPLLAKDPKTKGSAWQDNFGSAYAASLIEKGTPPKLMTFDFSLGDSAAHEYGPQGERARLALQEMDRNVGRVLAALDKRGLTESTLVVLTADHGMEHQSTDTRKLGGWFEALESSGVKTIESTRFVYIKNVQFSVHGTPRAGTSSPLAVRVVNDDARADGVRPAIANATVVIRDANGHTWRARTDASGVARITVNPRSGPLEVVIEHPEFTREVGSIPLA